MQFFIENNYGLSDDLLKVRLINNARRKLRLSKFGADELAMDKYLRENIDKNASLRNACTLIFAGIRISKDYHGYLIITIPNKKLNDIARLITYGNREVKGCSILRKIFTLK